MKIQVYLDIMDKIDDKSALQFALDKLEAGDISDFDAVKMEGFLDMIKSVMSIDKEIVEILKEQFADTLMKKAELMEAMKTVENGSVIVYFKSAQLYRIYKKDDIETLLGGQLKTLYKNIGMTYEVIPNSVDQKIIMIGDGSIVNSIEKIKSYIVSFMKDKGIKEIEEKDIVCYKDDENVEIIINNYYVKNSVERDTFIKELLAYITKKEKNAKYSNIFGSNTYSVVDGAAMVATPTNKQIIGKYVDPDRGLISNTNDCRQIQKNGDSYNIVYHIYNIQNTGDVHVHNAAPIIHTESESDRDHIEDFIDHIKETKPEWFLEGEWIERPIIMQKYVELYENAPKGLFAQLNGRLYKNEKRSTSKIKKGGRVTMVLLSKFDEIV